MAAILFLPPTGAGQNQVAAFAFITVKEGGGH
jgi:hypothetical protein